MKPIIKWPGGKTRELARIEGLRPPRPVLVEPFLGGGALFFRLEPVEGLLNDADPDLIAFYQAVRDGDSSFRDALAAMGADRAEIARRAKSQEWGFARLVAAARRDEDTSERAASLVSHEKAKPLALTVSGLEKTLAASIRDKARRLLRLEKQHQKVFDPEELPPHFETALQAGYYTAVRDLFRPEPQAGKLARFYFLRQLCYGSMFRFSKEGKFNIPYGGISYNRVDFAAKAEKLFSREVRDVLKRARLWDLDFEAFFEETWDRLDADAFVFLDPPYDTEFSSYANRAFTQDDHQRLADVFARLPCPALLVIQRTVFIETLYDEIASDRRRRGLPFFRISYGKTYGYNVRGRNDRAATHLLVGNYDPP